jgi:hypothetical protein
MTYAVSPSLQMAVFQHLAAAPTLAGVALYDALPSGPLPDSFITLGQEVVRDKSDKTGRGAEHEFTISVISAAAGFSEAKSIAAAICDALDGPTLTLLRGRLVWLRFERGSANREGSGNNRRIDLRFKARVEDN